jgi:hypothetical protein
MVVYASGRVKRHAVKYFLGHFSRWLKIFTVLTPSELEERPDFEYSIELLQVLGKIQDICDTYQGLPATPSEPGEVGPEAQQEYAERDMFATIKQLLNQIIENRGEPLGEDMVLTDEVVFSEREIVDVDEIALSSAEGAAVMPQRDADQRQIENIPRLLKDLNIAQVVGSIHYHYRSMDATDVLGFDPVKGRLPISDRKHCGHCGYSWTRREHPGLGNLERKENGNSDTRSNSGSDSNGSGSDNGKSNKSKLICPKCQCSIYATVDYGCMIDCLTKVCLMILGCHIWEPCHFIRSCMSCSCMWLKVLVLTPILMEATTFPCRRYFNTCQLCARISPWMFSATTSTSCSAISSPTLSMYFRTGGTIGCAESCLLRSSTSLWPTCTWLFDSRTLRLWANFYSAYAFYSSHQRPILSWCLSLKPGRNFLFGLRRSKVTAVCGERTTLPWKND